MVRSYLDLTIKFHDYSSFFAAFDVATYTNGCLNYEPLSLKQTYLLLSYLILSHDILPYLILLYGGRWAQSSDIEITRFSTLCLLTCFVNLYDL